MALTSTLLLDVPNQTLVLTYFVSSAQIDQVTYSTSGITFATAASFNLVKSDCILYNQILNTFFNSMLLNFPASGSSIKNIWPLSNFQISVTSVGVTHINYIQTSLGNPVYNINYVPLAGSAGFSARSQTTVTLQEFFQGKAMLDEYANQISLN